jgi:hypothetical protein
MDIQQNLRTALLTCLLLSTPHALPIDTRPKFHTPGGFASTEGPIQDASYYIQSEDKDHTCVTLYTFNGDAIITLEGPPSEAHTLLDPNAPKPQPVKQVICHHASGYKVFDTNLVVHASVRYYDKNDNLIEHYPYNAKDDVRYVSPSKWDENNALSKEPLDLTNLQEYEEIETFEIQEPQPNPSCLLL